MFLLQIEYWRRGLERQRAFETLYERFRQDRAAKPPGSLHQAPAQDGSSHKKGAHHGHPSVRKQIGWLTLDILLACPHGQAGFVLPQSKPSTRISRRFLMLLFSTLFSFFFFFLRTRRNRHGCRLLYFVSDLFGNQRIFFQVFASGIHSLPELVSAVYEP
jgi:hypothetical protein